MVRAAVKTAFVLAALAGVGLAKEVAHDVNHKHKHSVKAKRHESTVHEHIAHEKSADAVKAEDKKVEAQSFTFQMLDLNKDGVITEAEYKQVLGFSTPEQSGKLMRRAKTSIALDSRGDASAASLVEEEQEPAAPSTTAAAAPAADAAAATTAAPAAATASTAAPAAVAASTAAPVAETPAANATVAAANATEGNATNATTGNESANTTKSDAHRFAAPAAFSVLLVGAFALNA